MQMAGHAQRVEGLLANFALHSQKIFTDQSDYTELISLFMVLVTVNRLHVRMLSTEKGG